MPYQEGDIIYENKNGISCVGGKYLGSRKYERFWRSFKK